VGTWDVEYAGYDSRGHLEPFDGNGRGRGRRIVLLQGGIVQDHATCRWRVVDQYLVIDGKLGDRTWTDAFRLGEPGICLSSHGDRRCVACKYTKR
jgi:hypothetical protein